MIFKNGDEKLKKRITLSENDVFWELSDITPPKKNDVKKQQMKDTETAVVSSNEKWREALSESIPKREEYNSKLLRSYYPQNSLLQEVDVYSWHSKYTFYERFCVDAHRFYDVENDDAEYVKYFSYMPSYIQMSERQRKWYFYWRTNVRRGIYLPTDSSYVMLLVYEIINLPDLIDAQEGIELLCEIWKNYRKSYTKLDKYMSEWVCDYCLINRLELPYEKISSFIYDAVDLCALKQFYIPAANSDDSYAALLFARANTHKWWKSKYITDQNRRVFEKYVREGFLYTVRRLAASDGRFDGSQGARLVEKKAVRDSFSGALCAYDVKRRIEVSYLDLGNIGGLGFIVTDLVRYSENRVRAHFGIRARLGVQNLTEQQKSAVDEYFDYNLPAMIPQSKIRIAPDYDDHEEVREFSVNFDKAKEIEKTSWQTTDKLTDDLYDELDDEICTAESISEDKDGDKKQDVSVESEMLEFARKGLMYIAQDEYQDFLKLADESYMLPETLAQCVNELCYEILGDVGVEEKDGRYVLISDYEQEIKEWLKL